jgi:hypothetical protein
MCISFSLLGNGYVKSLLETNIQTAVEDLLSRSLSMRFVLYQKKVGNLIFPELLVKFSYSRILALLLKVEMIKTGRNG